MPSARFSNIAAIGQWPGAGLAAWQHLAGQKLPAAADRCTQN